MKTNKTMLTVRIDKDLKDLLFSSADVVGLSASGLLSLLLSFYFHGNFCLNNNIKEELKGD